jgi:DNA-binding protein Fis
MDNTVITSVLGFNFKADLVDKDNNPISIGVRSTMPNDFAKLKPRNINKNWFTNFNQPLLDKIIDYKKYNQ